jgi:hypothetical protein
MTVADKDYGGLRKKLAQLGIDAETPDDPPYPFNKIEFAATTAQAAHMETKAEKKGAERLIEMVPGYLTRRLLQGEDYAEVKGMATAFGLMLLSMDAS